MFNIITRSCTFCWISQWSWS